MKNKLIPSQLSERSKNLIGKISIQIALDLLKTKVIVARVGLSRLQVCWPIDSVYILKEPSQLAFRPKK